MQQKPDFLTEALARLDRKVEQSRQGTPVGTTLAQVELRGITASKLSAALEIESTDGDLDTIKVTKVIGEEVSAGVDYVIAIAYGKNQDIEGAGNKHLGYLGKKIIEGGFNNSRKFDSADSEANIVNFKAQEIEYFTELLMERSIEPLAR